MCAACGWPVFVCEYANNGFCEIVWVERLQAEDIVLDSIKLFGRRIFAGASSCAARSGVDVRAGESVIEETAGWISGLDTSGACKTEVRKAVLVSIDVEFAVQLSFNIGGEQI